MKATQITVFLENTKGRLAELTEILYRNNVQIVALSIAETADYGVVRMVVNDTELAQRVLQDASYLTKVGEVICLTVKNQPGALHGILKTLQEHHINVSYMYTYSTTDKANLLIKTSDIDQTLMLFPVAGDA